MSTGKNSSAGEPTAEAFLDALQAKRLVPGNTLASLRKQVAESKTRVAARQVAKLLVDKGLLTAALAQQLLAQQRLGGEAKRPATSAPASGQAATKSAPAPQGGTKPPGPRQPPTPTPEAPSTAAGLASLLEEEFSSMSGGSSALSAGPLDALLNDPSFAAAVEEAAPSPLDVPTPAKTGKGVGKSLGQALWGNRRARRRLWICLGSTAGLILAVVAISVWAATRQDPNTVLQPADAAYQEGAYAEAVKQYDAFLARYPKLAVSGRARVRRGLARLRLAFADTPSAAAVTATANEVLPEISPEAVFESEAGPVLATLLPPFAEASAAQAQRHPDRASIAESEAVLAVAEKYLPAADKPRERLGKVEAVLALARQKIAAEGELASALAAIRKAVGDKDFKEACRVRTGLLNAYPQFSTSDALTEAVAKIAEAQRASVAWVEKRQAAEKKPPDETVSTVIVAQRKFTASPPGTEKQVIVAVAAGAVYGLDAASGKVLWRNFVGFDPEGRDEGCTPVTVGPQADGDVVLFAPGRREFQRIEAASGEVKWRFAVPEGLCGSPVVAEDRVLASTASGRLLVIDAATGNSAGYVQFPQAPAAAAAYDPSRKLIFQAADGDFLYVLAMPGQSCRQVFPLGHRPGSIVAPPVVCGDYLLVAVNDTAADSTLRILEIRPAEPEPADPPLRLVQTISLTGHVDVGPSVAEKQILLVTDEGEVRLLELAPAGGKAAFRALARTQLDGGPGLVRFPLLLGGECFVGEGQLAKFIIDTAGKQLSLAWRDSPPGAVCQAPVAIGQTVFSVRRAGDLPGVVVSAVSAEKGEPYWQTCLAAPLAGEPVVSPDGRSVTAVTALGGVVSLARPNAPGTQSVTDVLVSPQGLRRPVTGVVRCGEKLGFSGGNGADQVFAFDPPAAGKPLAVWALPAPLACPPIALEGNLLAALSAGQVYLLDPLSGVCMATPFQPRLQAGTLPCWRRPVAVSGSEVVITDGRKKLYRLQANAAAAPRGAAADGTQAASGHSPPDGDAKPSLRLEAAAAVDLAEPFVSPLATTGKAVCGVDAANKLDFFQLPDLAPSQQHALAGRYAWGPCRIGNRVLLATGTGQCYCFDESGQLAWQAVLAYGRLAGPPCAVKEHLFFASTSGVVWRAEAASGKELEKLDVGRPLATGPVLWGDRLIVGGHDGTLYQVAIP